MDLRSGCPFWLLEGDQFPPYPQLDRDKSCDVAILGGGITGALVAWHLAEAGISAILLDRRQPGCGSTMASTGLLQYELDTTLCELIKLVGRKNAFRGYQLCVGTFDKFERLLTDIGDRCGFERCPSLYLASNSEDVADLKEEFKCRRAAGIDLQYLSESEIKKSFGFFRPAALLSRDGGQIDPYRLNQRLLQRSSQRGIEIFAKTHVTEYLPTNDRVKLITEHGPTITCRHIVFATGYETPQFLDQNIVTLKSTYALSTHPIRQPIDIEKTLLWETSRPYFYTRWGPDNRAMLGGEDEPFSDAQTRDELIPAKSAILCKKFRDMFGIPVEVECAWAGVFGETKDGLPYIGPHKQFPLGLFALGYGGNGITFSLVAAEIIRDTLLDRPNPDGDIFRFDR
ncbi:MAG TPA: FAD-dependent oxidoreductase [Tepidisphaeraceae bacterium]|jgi:glycine/D-amino acid oxidase-like deaminating enzyme|nr:FAD-dependent oxidoreductase [Tepidisphaeraceae bacterium]